MQLQNPTYHKLSNVTNNLKTAKITSVLPNQRLLFKSLNIRGSKAPPMTDQKDQSFTNHTDFECCEVEIEVCDVKELDSTVSKNKSEKSNNEFLKLQSSEYSMEQVLEPIYEETGYFDCILIILYFIYHIFSEKLELCYIKLIFNIIFLEVTTKK